MQLTSAAALYHASVYTALELLEQATARLKDARPRDLLHINILPSLSSRWLIPLLDAFKRRHPSIAVNVGIGDGPIDFEATSADIAVRVGRKNGWSGHRVDKIMGETLLAVCAPSLKAGKYAIRSVEDLASHTLLQHTTRPDMWREFLGEKRYAALRAKHGLGFEHFFMLIQAALDGLGVALIPRFLIARELNSQQLVPAFASDFQSPYSYYCISPRQKSELPGIRLFREWLLATAGG